MRGRLKMPDETGRNIVRIDADMEEIVPRFLEIRAEDVNAILKALGEGDYETIRRRGHSMKGAGASYGFAAVTDIGSSIENAAKIGASEEIRRLINELSAYLERVEVIYE